MFFLLQIHNNLTFFKVVKKLILPETINQYDFSKLARRESNGRVKLRLLAMHHLQHGKRLKETGFAVNVTSRTVSNWLKGFKINGLRGLFDKPHTGRHGYLHGLDSVTLCKEIELLQRNCDGGRIRGSDIIEHLKSK